MEGRTFTFYTRRRCPQLARFIPSAAPISVLDFNLELPPLTDLGPIKQKFRTILANWYPRADIFHSCNLVQLRQTTLYMIDLLDSLDPKRNSNHRQPTRWQLQTSSADSDVETHSTQQKGLNLISDHRQQMLSNNQRQSVPPSWLHGGRTAVFLISSRRPSIAHLIFSTMNNEPLVKKWLGNLYPSGLCTSNAVDQSIALLAVTVLTRSSVPTALTSVPSIYSKAPT